MTHERQRFLELLPFSATGRIAPEDAAWLRAYLEANPALQSQLAFHEALRDQLRASVDAGLPAFEPRAGLARAQALIQADRVDAAPGRHPAPPSAWWWPAGWFSAPAWRLAPVAMLLVIAVQAGWLVMLSGDGEPGDGPPPTAPTRAAGAGKGPGLADGPLLRVNFKGEATESEIRLALVDARSFIVAGPTRLGDYYLKAAPADLARARERLLGSGAVLKAEEVPGLPPELTER